MHSFILPLSFTPGILPANSQWMAANLVCGFGTAPMKSVRHKCVLAGDQLSLSMTLTDTLILFIVLHGKGKWSLVRSAQEETSLGYLVLEISFFPCSQKQLILPDYLRDILNQAKTTFTVTECGDSGDQNICCGSHCTGGEFQRFAGHALHQKQSRC